MDTQENLAKVNCINLGVSLALCPKILGSTMVNQSVMMGSSHPKFKGLCHGDDHNSHIQLSCVPLTVLILDFLK